MTLFVLPLAQDVKATIALLSHQSGDVFQECRRYASARLQSEFPIFTRCTSASSPKASNLCGSKDITATLNKVANRSFYSGTELEFALRCANETVQ